MDAGITFLLDLYSLRTLPVSASTKIADLYSGELLALVHSEISEALEVYRIRGESGLNDIWHREDGKPEGFTVELADTLIRIFDMWAAYELDLEDALKTKMEFNKSRPYRHGNKKA